MEAKGLDLIICHLYDVTSWLSETVKDNSEKEKQINIYT